MAWGPGNDLRTMSKECIDIVTNSELLAVHQDPAVLPYRLVWQSLPQLLFGQDDVQQVFARRMANGDEAVVLFNRFTTARNISVHWEQLGILPPWRPCSVRDLHSHSVLAPRQVYRLTLPTPPHGVRVLRIACTAAAAAVAPPLPPPLPPPPPIAPPPPPWNPPPTLQFGLEVRPCGAHTNASTQQFSWRVEGSGQGSLRLASSPELCVTYLGMDMKNVGLAECHGGGAGGLWVAVGIGGQAWSLSNTTAGSFVYNDCQPHGGADTVRCLNVAGCNISAGAFEVGDNCAAGGQGGCDQRWRLEAGLVRTAVDGFRSCLTLGAPK
eukprot:COSAG04_NODE_2_length_56781_cov_25.092252_14_plen_324_part_00